MGHPLAGGFMADIKKTVQKSNNDEFHRIETYVEEIVQDATTERVTTVKEEVVPMMVKKVVREKIVPVVASRIIESYDESGNIVNTEHEVVQDEATVLKSYERDSIAKTVEDAILRAEDAIRRAKAQELDIKNKQSTVDDSNKPKNEIQFEFDGNTFLYLIIAIEAAVVLYMTVLKGWLLN